MLRRRRDEESERPLRDIAYLLEQEAARMKVSTRILEEVVAELRKEVAADGRQNKQHA